MARRGQAEKKVVRVDPDIFKKYTADELGEYQQGFLYMDFDQDGVISKKDLRAAWDTTGRIANEQELDEMMAEAAGPISFPQMLNLFYNKLSGAGSTGDDDEAITYAFRVFEDKDGTIDAAKFREQLMSGSSNLQFTAEEVDMAFKEMEIENGRINSRLLTEMITGSNLDEEVEPEEEEEEAEEDAEEGGGD